MERITIHYDDRDDSWHRSLACVEEEAKLKASVAADPFHPVRRSKGDKHRNKARRHLK